MDESIQQVVINFLKLVLVPIILFMGVYVLLIAFTFWVFTDPLDLIEFEACGRTPGEILWDDCLRSTKTIFDDFNDTIGASYAQADEPSKEVQEFMKMCLELNK